MSWLLVTRIFKDRRCFRGNSPQEISLTYNDFAARIKGESGQCRPRRKYYASDYTVQLAPLCSEPGNKSRLAGCKRSPSSRGTGAARSRPCTLPMESHLFGRSGGPARRRLFGRAPSELYRKHNCFQMPRLLSEVTEKSALFVYGRSLFTGGGGPSLCRNLRTAMGFCAH